jgi:hypothetical protein
MRSIGIGVGLGLVLVSASFAALGEPAREMASKDAGALDGAPLSTASATDASLGDVAIADGGAGETSLTNDGATDAANDVENDAPSADAQPSENAAPTAANVDAGSGEPSDTGFSLGMHVGYALPFGLAKDTSIRDLISGAIPIGIDIGYIFDPHLHFGGYFTYGFANSSSGASAVCPRDPDDTCSADVFKFGVSSHWHFLPQNTVDPWAGLMLGYEVLNLSEDDANGNPISSAASHGIEVGAQAGVDFKPRRFYGFGPYMELSGGHYWGGESTVFHGWFGIGLRLRTGI